MYMYSVEGESIFLTLSKLGNSDADADLKYHVTDMDNESVKIKNFRPRKQSSQDAVFHNII